MRKNFIICALLMATMIILPLLTMEKPKVNVNVEKKTENVDDGFISVMLNENGYVEKMKEEEYVIGALAAEMDIGCHEEALKAQAVACYTYAQYCIENGKNEELNGADISDDSSKHQGYLNEDDRKEKWGNDFEKNEKKIEEIVKSVYGKKILYDNKPILAAYHDLCSGQTESAQTVWGKDIAYLQSVQSRGDTLSTDFTTSVVLSEDEFKMFAKRIQGVSLGDDAENWLGKTDVSDSGYVISLNVGSKKISGKDFRNAFGLKSCNFEVKYNSGKFTIKTIGNGHMVGMSQYGADYMARQGSGYREILSHYYVGTEVK